MEAAVKPTGRYLRRPLAGTAQALCAIKRARGYTRPQLTVSVETVARSGYPLRNQLTV